MSENSTETDTGSRVFLTSPDEHCALQFEVKMPEKGSALSVAEDLKKAHETAVHTDRPELYSGLYNEIHILAKAVSNVAERKIEEANLPKPIQLNVRAEYEKGVTALEAGDEVEKILDPMEEKLASDPQSTSNEYNDWLYPLNEVRNASSELSTNYEKHPLVLRGEMQKSMQISLPELVRAGQDLKSLLDREANRV